VNPTKQLLCRYSFAKKLQSQTVTREQLCKALSNQKGSCKTLKKLTSEFPPLSAGVAFLIKLDPPILNPSSGPALA